MNAIKICCIILMLSVISVSCRKADDSSRVNCDQLKDGLINQDHEILKTEIAKLVNDLNPVPVATDAIGHEKNMDLLIKRMNECNQLTAEIQCYACIKTLPAQSEILIRLDSANTRINRILDISTPENGKMSFASVHGDYSLK